MLWSTSIAGACPFCTALEPTLASRRETAAVVLLGEVESRQAEGATIRVHQTLKQDKSGPLGESIQVPAGGDARPGSLVLVFGTAADDVAGSPRRYAVVPVSETGAAYFAKSPDLRQPAAERLRYFARFLEHADPTVAGDAYQEFAHATYGEVRQAADALPMAKLPVWLLDARVPPARKGFYALCLALDAEPQARGPHAELLKKLILAPEDDFRAGFDGIVGGYLLLAGEQGLGEIDKLYLANPRAADGDVRHVLAALRFYREFGEEIPRERLAAALAHVLARPEFAAAAISDLARWQDWSALETISGLYAQPAYAAPATQRAIVGYLLACPMPAALAELQRLRARDPQGVAAAEQVLSRLGQAPQ